MHTDDSGKYAFSIRSVKEFARTKLNDVTSQTSVAIQIICTEAFL